MSSECKYFFENLSERRLNGREIIFIFEDNLYYERLKCEECKEILIQPYQTKCGCRLCYHCLFDFKKQSEIQCSWCDESILSFESNIMPDKATEKEIFKLKVKCINEECKEVVTFKDLKKHLEICEYREDKCDKCGEMYLIGRKEKHIKEKCSKTIISCKDCEKTMIRELYIKTHKNLKIENLNDLCDNWSSDCLYCFKKSFTNIQKHLFECPKLPIPCTLKDIGCNSIVLREEMDNHIISDAKNHFLLTTEALKKFQLKKKLNSIEENEKSLQLEICELRKNISTKNLLIDELKARCKVLEEENTNCKIHPNSATPFVTIPTNNSSLLYNNEFIWDIKNLSQRFQEAKSGTVVHIQSEEFYTKKPGYKLQLKAYPNGDGVAKNKYFSLFLVILKGEYDNLISWPFKSKITLSTSFNNFSVSLRPDDNLSCYGKPMNGFNLGAGYPEFIKLDDLLKSKMFLISDTLSVKVIVH